MKPKFLLMRHAESKHNKEKKIMQKQNPNYKDSH